MTRIEIVTQLVAALLANQSRTGHFQSDEVSFAGQIADWIIKNGIDHENAVFARANGN